MAAKGRLKMTANEFKSVQRCAAKPISNELKYLRLTAPHPNHE
ncbi:hypothetical protein NEISICOT_00796 [Neisseria sicca ATCC 29256]|uniref:Uncharacterized protein n=1 Tax=Neisseria sicca ATCC 29256 TaxID=547045 RepID=C6M2Q7_NEISI|nr:hypothetical protein NEISICOT_00796 [Neisseria sicca ATCC 29256]